MRPTYDNLVTEENLGSIMSALNPAMLDSEWFCSNSMS
jgi:hypothetical protein